MDLALAKFVEAKLPRRAKLDAAQYGLLTQACRQAKEALLGPNPPAQQTVTVVGRGRSVIGGTLHAPLTPDDVRQVIFDGFFPNVAGGDSAERGAKAGLHEMGLPYVSDPAVTRHLAAFLAASPAARLVPRRSSSTAASSSPPACATGSSTSCAAGTTLPGSRSC